MKRWILSALFLSLPCVLLAQQPAEVDWEKALADYHQLDNTIKDNQRAKLTGERLRQRQRWIIANYPGTDLAARTEAGFVQEALYAGRIDAVGPTLLAFIDKYPLFTDAHSNVIIHAQRAIGRSQEPDDAKLAAYESLIPAMKDRSLQAGRMIAAVRKLKVSALAKYAFTKRMAESVGPYPGMRADRWDALRAAARELGDKYLDECKALAAWAGADTAVGRAARVEVLRQAGDEASARELAAINEQDAAAADAVAKAFDEAKQRLAANDPAGAAAALDRGLQAVRPDAAETAWLQLLRQPAMAEISAMPIYDVLLKRAPDGDVIDAAYVGLREHRFDARGMRMLVKLAARHKLDRHRSTDIAEFAVRAVATSEDPPLQLEAVRAAADVAKAVRAEDRRVSFLVAFAKMAWDQSPDQAKAALREAAARHPAIPEAAEAGWMLALFEGKLSVTQGPLPRPVSPEERLPLRPAVQLPPAPAPADTVVQTSHGLMLVAQDTKADLLAGRSPAASHAADTAALAVDGKADTAWTPDKLPASIIVPLAKESTVDRIQVVSESGLFFTASLLDRQGRTLARMERDWAFWDYYRRTSYWPDANVTLSTLATPGVCYVRLDVYAAAEGNAVVQTLSAFGSPQQAAGQTLAEPVALPAGAKAVAVTWEGDQPVRTITYTPAGEWMRGYYVLRWGRFWTRVPRNLALTSAGGAVAFSLYGDDVTVTLDRPGAVRWAFDDEKWTYLAHPQDEPTDHPLPKRTRPGLHILRLANDRLEQKNDTMAAGGVRIGKVDVNAVARLHVAVRFGTKAGQWGPWMGPVDKPGTSIAVPTDVDGARPELVQAAAFFDGREVRGTVSPTLKSLSVSPASGVGQTLPPLDLNLPVPLKETLPEVAELLQRRALAVVYPKSGTAEEYEAAKRLADKAQAYLVSDDIGLNGSKGRVLAVGTPHRNRWCRQLLATHGLWHVPAYFADEDGIVALDQNPESHGHAFVTGETPEAVVRAADRLLAAIKPAESPASPVRLIASHTLANVFGWQIDSAQPAPGDVTIRLAAGDRRSAQVGVVADRAVARLTVSITDPTGPGGAKLPRPLVRPVGFYEWVPFFGETRIPNALLSEPTVSMPANTARGVWITVVTPADAKAGEYRAELTVDADGARTSLPVVIRVEPFALPAMTKTVTHSFAHLPYWFHEGTPQWEKALRELARNEAEHGVTLAGTALQFKWTREPHTLPVRMAVAPPAASPEGLEWKPYIGAAKQSPAGQSLVVGFAEPIRPREIIAALNTGEVKLKVTLSYWDGGQWVAKPPFAAKSGKALPRVGNWSLDGTPVQYVRLTADGGAAYAVDRIAAYTDLSRQYAVTLDFSDLDHMMTVYEEEYAKLGMKPLFVVQTNDFLTSLGGDLYGVSHSYYSGIARFVGPQLNAMLEKTGRTGRVFFKVADEPPNMTWWMEVAADYHRAGLRTMTCHAILPDMKVAAGVLNPWCPYYGHDVQAPFFRERQKAGDSFWWYTYGPPNMRLTGQPSENLIFYWLTGKWRIDGAMNYAAMHASNYSMPVPFRYEAGQDHRILFLPDGTLLDTPRRALEGEGISDLKLIEFVRANGDAAVQEELEKLLAKTTPYKFGYATDPEHWLKAREALYDLAVRAAK